MPGRLLSVPFGPPATRALAALLADVRGGDPFAPATVTVPSATAGTTLRRRLAVDGGGLVGVTFQSLPQLAARLAAPALLDDDRRPLAPPVLRGHIRAALRQLDGALGAAAASPATERAVEASLAELADLDDAELADLAALGGVAGGVAAVARHVRAAAPRSLDAAAVVRAATAALEGGAAPPGDVGPVIVHLPRRLRPAEVRLLAALGARTTVAVTVGRTGDPAGDEPADALLAAVGPAIGAVAEVVDGPAGRPVPTALLRAPDPAEEAAAAARLVVGALERGVVPERIAVLHRVRDPYAAILHEHLGAARIPHHAGSVGTLAQSVAGRVLLGALALPDGRFRRSQVVAWWRSGPVRNLATGRRVPVATWDRIAREAGVVVGLDQWRQRLDQAADLRRHQQEAWAMAADGPDEPTLPDIEDRHLADIAAVTEAVGALAARLEPPAEAMWRAWSAWSAGLLRDALGDGTTGDWPGEEAEARVQVDAAVRSLADLDGVDAPPDLRRFRHALERELERPARPHGRFGHGVAVGRLVDGVGADLDLVVVVGAAEGQLPPRRRDDALLPDRVRAAVGLERRSLSRDEETRDLLAALAAAPERVLVAPRSDPRDQRERQPAPAFLDACGARAGRMVASEELRGLRHEPWFDDVESFEWWPAGGRPEQVRADVDLGLLLADHRAGRDVSASAVAAADPDLARGLAAASARRSGAFDAWSGNVGSRPDLLEGFTQPRSPTGLEQYATCPARFFFGNVLRIRALDDPTEADVMSGRDVGTLVHAVLERFLAEHGVAAGKRPEDPWSDDERDALLAIADDLAGRFEAEGRAGRPLLWGVRWHQLRRQLLAILDDDEEVRASRRSIPVAVEHAFGGDGSEPVVLDLGGGRTVAFKGIIDRVDRSDDGRRLLVVDYKTGSDWGYDVDDGDLTARGQKLQLGVYALAARQANPGAEDVEARYWFTGGGRSKLRGGDFDEAAEGRFREVVTTILDGVEAGRFPANPGEERWDRGRYVYDHCRYCDFDRICPTTRGWRWQQARSVPELAGYVELAENAYTGPAPDEDDA